jgi:SAM-dependent methyltransferase
VRGSDYYEEEWFHDYLLSPLRREIFPPSLILDQISFEGVTNMLDFGMGNGFFVPHLLKRLPGNATLYGAECQELMIDMVLHQKVIDNYQNFIPFFQEKNEHPLLPDWLPDMELILCSCVLSVFANPSLALQGVGRNLARDGRIIVLDWDKVEAPSGPEITQKISLDRMKYFIEDAEFSITRTLKINRYFYGMEIVKNQNAITDSPAASARAMMGDY